MPDLSILAIFLLIILSAFFSATEIAFAGVNTARLRSRLEKKKSLPVSLALRLAERYDDALGAVLIGNNLANNAASAIATVMVLNALGEGYVWIATAVMTLVVLIFGEIIPKVLAKQFSEKFSVATAVPIYGLSVILKPITALFLGLIQLISHLWEKNISDADAVSEDDLENIIDIAEDEGVLDEEQSDLLQNALDFDHVLAYEIITPRVDMTAVDIRDSYEVNIRKITESIYSRIPVYEDTPDHIIGFLHQNHVFKEMVDADRVDLRGLLLPVTFVHKTMPLPDVLEKMKESKCHMVVVLDEYGGTMGILTMEDVLEQLVGEIWDETDEIEREFVCVDDTHFEAIGEMRLIDFFDEFDIDIEEDEDFSEDNTTVGGWVTSMLEGEIKVGDSFRYENFIITVLACDDKRIDRIGVEELKETEE
ncbi:MAG: HlyC/CorC family transporter [Clostridia bacterium]|nr:HlyC/CorC family transporter [Clostridia bacterium]